MTSLQFHSTHFEYQRDLPEHYNAGNRFHGEDVAQFIASGLRAAGYEADSLDEDWGWLVSSRFEGASVLEIAIYNLSEHREGGRAGVPQWGLWLRAWRRKKILGFVPATAELPVTAAQVTLLREIFAARDIALTPWPEGPDGEGAV